MTITKSRTHKLVACFAVIAMILTFIVLVMVNAYAASAKREFGALYSAQKKGEVVTIGNTLMLCDQKNERCQKAINGQITRGRPATNNGYRMVGLHNDPSAPDKVATSAQLSIPAGAEVEKAYLIWGARKRKESSVPIEFKVPGGSYQVINETEHHFFSSNTSTNSYTAYADVTDLVKKAGSGEYWAGGIDLQEKEFDAFAGWSLITVLKGQKYPTRDLRVFFGHEQVDRENKPKVKIDGLVTPPFGEVNAKAGFVTFEGDQGFTGDAVSVTRIHNKQLTGGEKDLSDPGSHKTNFLNSSITSSGKNVESRNPHYKNNMGVDIKEVDITNLENSDEGALFKFKTVGDYYYVTAFSTQIDLYVPEFDGQGTKSVKNITGDQNLAKTGDILEYTLTIHNTGQDAADDFVLEDDLSEHLQYIPGSMKLDGASLSDGAGDDQAEFVNNKFTVRAGKGANATKGGTVNPDDVFTFTYRVKIKASAASLTVDNDADYHFTQHTLGKKDSQKTNNVKIPVAASADLGITKTGPQTIDAGDDVTWTLTAKNYGPNTSKEVVVTDQVPQHITNVTVTPADKCSVNKKNLVTCNFDSLAKDATQQIQVRGHVASNSTQESMVNTATISSNKTSEPSNDVHKNTASVPTTIERHADVTVTSKTVSPSSVRPGEEQTWVINVSNNGPSDAKQVNVTDTLPSSLVIQGTPVASHNGQCSVESGSISCNFDTLTNGTHATVTIKTKLKPSYTGGDIRNEASITSKTPDSDTNNNSGDKTLTVLPSQADVIINKSVTPDTVYAGETATFHLKIDNKGPSRARDITVTDTLPEGFTYVDAKTPVNGQCEAQGQKVTCTFNELTAGGTLTIPVKVQLASSVTGNVSNTATVTASNGKEPHSSTVNFPVKQRADLSLEKTTSDTTVVAGKQATFSLVAKNEGTADATNAKITDVLPEGLQYVSSTVTRGQGTCSFDESTRTLVCIFASLAAKKEAHVELVVQIPQNSDVSDIENTASVSSDTYDPNKNNDESTAGFSTSRSADMNVKKTVVGKTDDESVHAGEVLTWKLVATNKGPSSATSPTIVDTIPDEVLLDDVKWEADEGVTCQIDSATRKLICTKESLANNKDITVTVTAPIDPATESTAVSNRVTVKAKEDDPTIPNTDTTNTTIATDADLQIVKDLKGDGLIAGENAVWTLTVTNHGPSVSRAVKVVDKLPQELSFVSAKPDTAGVTCGKDDEAVRCSAGDMAPGKTIVIEVTTKVDPSLASDSQVANKATTFSDGGTADHNTGNNESEVKKTVTTKESLTIRKEIDKNPLVSGTTATYTIHVTNGGPSWAHDVTVKDILPKGLKIDNEKSVASSKGDCSVTGQVVSCAVDSVALGDDNGVTIVIPVKVTGEGESITNRAEASSPKTTTPVKTTLRTPNKLQADISVTKRTDVKKVVAGAGMRWYLGATNAGPSRAHDVVVSDVLPEHMTFDSADKGCSYQASNRTVTCKYGTLEMGDFEEKQIVVTIDSDTKDKELSNTATITQSDKITDPTPDDNSVTKPIPVQRHSHLLIKKKVVGSSISAGTKASWRLAVTNSGPSDASGVTVTDTFPAGVVPTSAKTKDGSCVIEGQKLTCTYQELPVGVATIQVETTVTSTIEGKNVTNEAQVDAKSPYNSDGDGSEDTRTSVTIPLVHKADLVVKKTASPKTFVPGEDVTYTLTAINKGPSVAKDVIFTDELQDGLTNIKATSENGNCTVTLPEEESEKEDPDADPNEDQEPPLSGTVECKISKDVAVGETVTVTITAHLKDSLTGDFANTALADHSYIDPNRDDNSPTVRKTLQPLANVEISKTLSKDVVAGSEVSWVVKVVNHGPSQAREVAVTDAVNSAVTDLKASINGTSGSTDSAEAGANEGANNDGSNDASGGADSGTDNGTDASDNTDNNNADSTAESPKPPRSCQIADGNVVNCSLGSMASEEVVTITISGKLDSAYEGELANTASVVTKTKDPDMKNNQYTRTGTTAKESDLRVSKVANKRSITAGGHVRWTITVVNAGPSDAKQVVVSDPLPQSATVTGDITAPDGTDCQVKSGFVNCTVDKLPAGEAVKLVIPTVIDKGFVGAAKNSVSVSAPGYTDKNVRDNLSSFSVEVQAPKKPVQWQVGQLSKTGANGTVSVMAVLLTLLGAALLVVHRRQEQVRC